MSIVQQIAKEIDGMKRRKEPSIELQKLAENNNCLIIFGESDDLLEMRGIINDEGGIWDNGTLYLIPSSYTLPDDTGVFNKELINFIMNDENILNNSDKFIICYSEDVPYILRKESIKIDYIFSENYKDYGKVSWQFEVNSNYEQTDFKILNKEGEIHSIGKVVQL